MTKQNDDGSEIASKRQKTNEDDVEELQKRICDTLNEPNQHMVGLVLAQVGAKVGHELFTKAQEESKSDTGVMLADGSGKRTPGGVFFNLAKEHIGRTDFNRLSKQNRKHRKSLTTKDAADE